MSIIEEDEFIFYKNKDGEIYSGGFHVNSIIMKEGISPIVTLNNENQNGGEQQVSDLFRHIVVPNWIFTFPMKYGGSKISHDKKDEKKEVEVIEEEEDNVIDEDIHDKLLSMVTVDKKEINKKQTKKLFFLKNKNNQTKKKKSKK